MRNIIPVSCGLAALAIPLTAPRNNVVVSFSHPESPEYRAAPAARANEAVVVVLERYEENTPRTALARRLAASGSAVILVFLDKTGAVPCDDQNRLRTLLAHLSEAGFAPRQITIVFGGLPETRDRVFDGVGDLAQGAHYYLCDTGGAPRPSADWTEIPLATGDRRAAQLVQVNDLFAALARPRLPGGRT